MKRTCKKLAFLGVLVVGSASATEMRTPWIAERGPLRYTFEKLHNDKKCNVNYWTALHAKEAHKAFLSHSTKAKELSALIFNKADFTLNEIFPNSHIDMTNENYSPWLNIVAIHPRVEYSEWGITTGGRFDCEVWKGKGRIGMRATVPFRSVEMEREDMDEDYEDPEEQFVATQLFRLHDNTTVVAAKTYNMALLAGLPLDDTRVPALVLKDVNNVTTFGKQALGINLKDGDNDQIIPTNIKTLAGVFQYSRTPVPSDNKRFAFDDSQPNMHTSQADRTGPLTLSTAGVVTTAVLSDANTNKQFNGFGFFNSFDAPTTPAVRDYSNLTQAQLSQLWLVLGRDTAADGPDNFVLGANPISQQIEKRLQLYQQDPMNFFAGQGFEMQTSKRRTLGDIDVDLFYEHTFNKEWIGELFIGTRIPTGGTRDEFGNPYNAQTGNGEHWEVKLGGMIAYQPAKWINMKLDAYYSFVIEATEHRMAAFKGAQIKNFGPRADADVDWGYFVGRLDFNFFHPKTSDIRTLIGYEFYYKTEDHLTYKQSTLQSFAGEKLVQVTPPTDPATYTWVADPRPLDNGLARKHTESISHKFRGEISYQASTYFELYASASSTFAGQNVFRDSDCQGGFVVRF
jgi:predicted transport protein